MSAVPKLKVVSVEDYLAGELDSPVKHEHLGGFVYAMAGARSVHNQIVSNLLGSLFGRLRGKPCRGIELPLAEIYGRVEFVPEDEKSED